LEFTSKELNHSDIELIRTQVRDNKNQLFNLTQKSENFFELVKGRSTQADLLPLLSDVLLDLKNVKPEYLPGLKDFLFKKTALAPSFFELLMQRDESNQIFDALLTVVTDKELNSDVNKKLQMLDYAHSIKRYEYIFLQEQNLPSNNIQEAHHYLNTLRSNFSPQVIQTMSTGQPQKYAAWLEARRVSSTTLSIGDRNAMTASIQRWNAAEEARSRYANQDRGTEKYYEFDRIKLIHLKMCRGEVGIPNPGELRSGIVRTAGGWTHFYCPKDYLNDNVEYFMKWFNGGLRQCNEGKLNPVIFAAQTYQRFVSFHPFENGNGRVSRLLMDYVLERFNVPPPILGKDILDAVFPMSPLKPQEDFLKKIIEGIEKSRKMLT